MANCWNVWLFHQLELIFLNSRQSMLHVLYFRVEHIRIEFLIHLFTHTKDYILTVQSKKQQCAAASGMQAVVGGEHEDAHIELEI